MKGVKIISKDVRVRFDSIEEGQFFKNINGDIMVKTMCSDMSKHLCFNYTMNCTQEFGDSVMFTPIEVEIHVK